MHAFICPPSKYLGPRSKQEAGDFGQQALLICGVWMHRQLSIDSGNPLILLARKCHPCHRSSDLSTARGFEPLRAEPNGFRVHLLGRSDTLSLDPENQLDAKTHNLPESACAHSLPTK